MENAVRDEWKDEKDIRKHMSGIQAKHKRKPGQRPRDMLANNPVVARLKELMKGRFERRFAGRRGSRLINGS